MSKKVLAFDFGASSGRGIIGYIDNDVIKYEEVHRFNNGAIERNGRLVWDIETLFSEVKYTIEKAGKVDSIGFDTWGVDYGIIDQNGKLVDYPTSYRDPRTETTVKTASEVMSYDRLYEITGNQIMTINTLFQLLAEKEDLNGKKILFMPDLFAYMLTGNMVCEKTIASTSQMLDIKTHEFSNEILDKFNIDRNIFPKIVEAGTVVGTYNDMKVISVAGHDTECAIYSVPTLETEFAYLSCGTWSLFGVEIDEPILTKESCDNDLSNEISANGKVDFLKNIVGLWIIQECKRCWGEYSYSEIAKMASDAEGLKSFIDVDDKVFGQPCDMPKVIQEYCLNTNQNVPQTVGEIARCVYESLAMKYRFALNQIEEVVKKHFETLYIVGGGSRADILCQLTANALNRKVVAGVEEATAIGNIAIQLKTLGEIHSDEDVKKLIIKGENLRNYVAEDLEKWNAAYEQYLKIII